MGQVLPDGTELCAFGQPLPHDHDASDKCLTYEPAQQDFSEDPVLGEDGYPTDTEIARIKGWPGVSQEDGIALMDYIHERWLYAKIGYWTEIEDRNGARFYEIHTGGWSGNEDLASALEDTLLGTMALQSYHRGGHYLFTFKKVKAE